MVVSDYGGKRSDAGSLGTGIYFGLDASTSVKYSSPGQTRGSRFLLICDVALGSVKVMSLLYLLFSRRVRSSFGRDKRKKYCIFVLKLRTSISRMCEQKALSTHC